MKKIITGHQPVYLPWLGFFHKAMLADIFIYMDDVQYLNEDWNNRNLIKNNYSSKIWLTVPVDKKNSNSNLIKDIKIKDQENIKIKERWNIKHWNSISNSYANSPYFKGEYKDYFEWVYLENKWSNLSDLNYNIITKLFKWLDISCKIEFGSMHEFTQKKSNLILEHAKKFNADIVLTGINGVNYIKETDFNRNNIKVFYQNYIHPIYRQKYGSFISNLSIIDLIFNEGSNSKDIILSNNIKKENLLYEY